MKKLILLFSFSSLVAVAQLPAIQITKSMMDKPTKMKLSELVDDITFIKLETNKANLLKSNYTMKYTKDFIYSDNRVFTWDGKWKVTIGLTGRGPYEEISGFWFIDYKNGKFISKGDKIIEFDSNGTPTKKVRNVKSEKLLNNGIGSSLTNARLQTVVGNDLFLTASDAVYFVNVDNFQTDRRIELIPNKVPSDVVWQNGSGNISFYRDNIIFSNAFIDSVFYVKNRNLQPMWKFQIDKDIKMPMDYFHKIQENIADIIRGGKKSYSMRSGKVMISNVYETTNFLFLRVLRFKTDDSGLADNYYLCYDKTSKSSKVMREDDLVDDIWGLGAWRKVQIYDEKILMTLWSFEILEIIDKKKEKGEKIHPKLAALAKQIDEGDNPIIFVAHLKK